MIDLIPKILINIKKFQKKLKFNFYFSWFYFIGVFLFVLYNVKV